MDSRTHLREQGRLGALERLARSGSAQHLAQRHVAGALRPRVAARLLGEFLRIRRLLRDVRAESALRASEQHRYGLEISCLKPHLDNFSRNHTGAGGKYMPTFISMQPPSAWRCSASRRASARRG